MKRIRLKHKLSFGRSVTVFLTMAVSLLLVITVLKKQDIGQGFEMMRRSEETKEAREQTETLESSTRLLKGENR